MFTFDLLPTTINATCKCKWLNMHVYTYLLVVIMKLVSKPSILKKNAEWAQKGTKVAHSVCYM